MGTNYGPLPTQLPVLQQTNQAPTAVRETKPELHELPQTITTTANQSESRHQVQSQGQNGIQKIVPALPLPQHRQQTPHVTVPRAKETDEVAGSAAKVVTELAKQVSLLSTDATDNAQSVAPAPRNALLEVSQQRRPPREIQMSVQSLPRESNHTVGRQLSDNPDRGQRPSRGRGRGNFISSGAQKIQVPQQEYDFASANALFMKPDISAADSATVSSPSGSVYDKKSSFFDNISSEIKERADRVLNAESIDGRAVRGEERKLNYETFGEDVFRRNGQRGRGGRGRGRGAGLGGRGRGRGSVAHTS